MVEPIEGGSALSGGGSEPFMSSHMSKDDINLKSKDIELLQFFLSPRPSLQVICHLLHDFGIKQDLKLGSEVIQYVTN